MIKLKLTYEMHVTMPSSVANPGGGGGGGGEGAAGAHHPPKFWLIVFLNPILYQIA